MRRNKEKRFDDFQGGEKFSGKKKPEGKNKINLGETMAKQRQEMLASLRFACENALKSGNREATKNLLENAKTSPDYTIYDLHCDKQDIAKDIEEMERELLGGGKEIEGEVMPLKESINSTMEEKYEREEEVKNKKVDLEEARREIAESGKKADRQKTVNVLRNERDAAKPTKGIDMVAEAMREGMGKEQERFRQIKEAIDSNRALNGLIAGGSYNAAIILLDGLEERLVAQFNDEITVKKFIKNKKEEIRELEDGRKEFEDKIIAPEEIKRKFGMELELLIEKDRRDLNDGEKTQYEDHIKKMGESLGYGNSLDMEKAKSWNIFKKIFGKKENETKGDVVLEEMDRIKREAEDWLKREICYGKEKESGKLGKVAKMAGHFGANLVEVAAAFKVAGGAVSLTGLAAIPGFAPAAAAAGGSFLTAGLLLWGGRKLAGRLAEKRRSGQFKEIILDWKNPETKSLIAEKMAAIISLDQADRANKERIEDDKKYEKMRRKYILGNISDEKFEKFLIKKAKKEVLKAENKEKDADSKEKKDIKNMSEALGILGKEEDVNNNLVEKEVYKLIKNNPELEKRMNKKGLGKEYMDELKGLALYEVPLLRMGLIAGGGSQEFIRGVDLGLGDKDWYKNNKYARTALRVGAGITGAAAFSLIFSRGAEGFMREAKHEAGIWGSLGEGKLGLGEFGAKWWGDIKSRHRVAEEGEKKIFGEKEQVAQIKEAEDAPLKAEEAEIDKRFWEKIGETEKGMGKDMKDIEVMKILSEKIKGLDGDGGKLSLEDKARFLQDTENITGSAVLEAKKRIEAMVIEAERKLKVDMEKFILEERRQGKDVKQRLLDKIKNLDGDNRTISIEDLNKYEGAARENLIQELKGKIADEIRIEKEAATQQKAASKKKMPLQPKESKTALPAAVGVERITVKSGDKVWNIAEKMATDLGIDMPKGSTPQEIAQRTYITDAVKDEMAAQMKGQGFEDAGLIKEGQSFNIDKGDVMERLKARKIIVDEANNIKQLTLKEVENILKNNELNRKAAVKKGEGAETSPDSSLVRRGQETVAGRKGERVEKGERGEKVEKGERGEKVEKIRNQDEINRQVDKESERIINENREAEANYKEEMKMLNKMKGKHIEEPVVVNRNTLEAVESRKVKMERELADGRELTRECQEFYERLWKKDDAQWREKVASEVKANLKGNELSTPDFNEESNAGKILDFLRIEKYLGKEKMNKLITTSEEMEIAKKLSNFGFKGKAFDEKFQNSKKCLEVLGRTRKDMDLSRKADFLEMWVKPEKGNIGEYLQQEGFRIPDTDRLQWTWDVKGGKLIIKNGVEIEKGVPQKLTIYLEGEHTGEYGRRNWWGSNRWFKTRNGFMKDLDKKK